MKALIYPIYIIAVFTIFVACGTDGTSTAETEEAPSVNKNSAQLAPEYRNMLNAIKANPNDHERNGALAGRVAKQFIELKLDEKAIDVLKNSIIFDYQSKSTNDNIKTLIEVYKNNPKYKDSYINLVQSLQIGNSSFNGLSNYTGDIPSDEKSVKVKIEEIRASLTDSSTGRLDLKRVNEFVDIIELFVIANPTNDQSPEYLKLAAEVVNSIKVYPRAIQFYDWTLTRFPNSKQAAQALFMKGFTLDDGMKKKNLAKPVYEEFLRKYPKNDFADDTKFLLDNINKSDEEIIKQFEKKEK